MWIKGKETRIAKTILQKSYKVRVIILSDMKSSYIATVIKTVVLYVG